jgi:hypothetical protein
MSRAIRAELETIRRTPSIMLILAGAIAIAALAPLTASAKALAEVLHTEIIIPDVICAGRRRDRRCWRVRAPDRGVDSARHAQARARRHRKAPRRRADNRLGAWRLGKHRELVGHDHGSGGAGLHRPRAGEPHAQLARRRDDHR